MSDTPGQNIWNKIEKSSKTGQNKNKFDIFFACFLTAIAKGLFLKRRLGARLFLHPNSEFFRYSLTS